MSETGLGGQPIRVVRIGRRLRARDPARANGTPAGDPPVGQARMHWRHSGDETRVNYGFAELLARAEEPR